MTEMHCQGCQKPIQPYHQFCPFCDLDVAPSVPDDSLSSPADVALQPPPPDQPPPACPACNKAVEAHHTFCPWCDADLAASDNPAADAVPAPSAPSAMAFCRFCGQAAPPESNVCRHCGQSLTAPAVPANAVSGLQGPPYPISPVMAGGIAAVDSGGFQPVPGMVPLTLFYDAHRFYRENALDVLEVYLLNNGPQALVVVKAELQSHLLPRPLMIQPHLTVPSGGRLPWQIPGFHPRQAGRDALRLCLEARTPDGRSLHLTGSVVVDVQAAAAPPPRGLNINISAQYMIADEIGDQLAQLQRDTAPVARPPAWVAAPLDWNMPRQSRETRYFPPACFDVAAFNPDPNILHALADVSPENAPRAALNTPHQTVYHLVAGTVLRGGRQKETCHLPAILYPEDLYRPRNLKVSREHFHIHLSLRQALLHNHGGNKTITESGALAAGEEALLADNEKISVAGILDLRVGIFTDGQRIHCLRLSRLLNQTSEQFILAAGCVPIGSAAGLPISLSGLPSLAGCLLYHTDYRAWCFQPPGGRLQVLGSCQELTLGGASLWFAAL